MELVLIHIDKVSSFEAELPEVRLPLRAAEDSKPHLDLQRYVHNRLALGRFVLG